MTELIRAARELLGADARVLEGGYSGETFLVRAAGEDAVLRLYAQAPGRALVDTALLELVRGILPVPRVLDARPGRAGGPGHVLAERLPGVRLEQFLAEGATTGQRREAGREAGRLLALLSGIPFAVAGEFVVGGTDPEKPPERPAAGLSVRPWPPQLGGLPEWVEANRANGRLASWSAAEFEGLLEVAVDAQARLDTLDRVCLVHSDFNPKNLLVDPATGTITGLVDWEYAHAGMPHADLGNLLRFETDEPFCRAVVTEYRERAPGAAVSGEELLELARSADLFALVELAARERTNRITELAADLLRRTAREQDLAAGRPAWD